MDIKNISIEVVKTCDMDGKAAAAAFIGLNALEGTEIALIINPGTYSPIMKTSYDPANMVFPNGWYFAKGSVRNKHHSTTGFYDEVPVMDGNSELWQTYRVEDARQVDGKDFDPIVLADVIVAMNAGAKKVNAWTVKLTKLEKMKSIKVLEGYNVKVEDKKIILSSGCNKVFITY